MIDFLIENPSLVQGAICLTGIVLAAVIALLAAPTIEHFFNPSISE